MDFEPLFQRIGGLRPIAGDAFAPLNEADISAIETLVGVRLPEDYRAFLAHYGASAFRRLIQFKPIHPLPSHISPDGSDYIDAFYGREPDAYSLPRHIRLYKDRMQSNIIPIGTNGGGNQICIGVAGDLCGKVLYWDRHNEFDEEDYLEDHNPPVPEEMLFRNVHLIAHTFDDFLRRLEVDPNE